MRVPVKDQSLSESVIEMVADAEDVDPIDLQTPLYEVIDPDALDSLFEPADGAPPQGGQVVFEYSGYTVAVTSDGTVTLANGDEQSPSLSL